jgi:phosphate transport system protein
MEIRTNFHRSLKEIEDELLTVGSMVEKGLLRSMEALKNRNLELANQIIADDKKINSLRYDIEDKCIHLIATQQPMAVDLRKIVSMLSIVAELERIGDHAEGIGKIVIMIGDEPPLKPLIDLPRMTDITVDMLRRALQAFINSDEQAARKIVKEDDSIDDLYNQVFRELISFMVEDPRTITRATRLIWVAHNLERSADRVTNICERVIFVVTGKLEDLNVSKY